MQTHHRLLLIPFSQLSSNFSRTERSIELYHAVAPSSATAVPPMYPPMPPIAPPRTTPVGTVAQANGPPSVPSHAPATLPADAPASAPPIPPTVDSSCSFRCRTEIAPSGTDTQRRTTLLHQLQEQLPGRVDQQIVQEDSELLPYLIVG